jgi:hypothetical protein
MRQVIREVAVADPAAVPSRWLFDEYAKEIGDRPEKLKNLLKLRGKFVKKFPAVPVEMEWPRFRDWLYATRTGESGLTVGNQQN